MKILIAEDNTAAQMLLGMHLDTWGFEFDMASNGQEAVELAKLNNGKYDLCLMDTDMPVMNGFEAIKMIRRMVKYFPILSLSGDFTYKNRCLESGADEFLAKPCPSDTLLAKIKELVIKSFKLVSKNNSIVIKEELPMDAQHAQELRELKNQDLIKIKFDDVSGSEVVVHKNIMNKIVQDFNIRKQFVSIFLNRNPDKPTKCILFSNNCRMPQVYLDDIDYKKELQMEDEEVKKYPKMIFKAEED